MTNKPNTDTDAVEELKNCPFCGDSGIKTACCGAAIPNCPKCSDLFGCHRCDIWFDTDEEWNTRTESALADELAAYRRMAGKAEYISLKGDTLIDRERDKWCVIRNASDEYRNKRLLGTFDTALAAFEAADKQ